MQVVQVERMVECFLLVEVAEPVHLDNRPLQILPVAMAAMVYNLVYRVQQHITPAVVQAQTIMAQVVQAD
jgi:hypothetical protein